MQRAAEDAKLRQILNDNWTRFIFEEGMSSLCFFFLSRFDADFPYFPRCSDPSGFLGPSNNIDEAISFLTRGSSMETSASSSLRRNAAHLKLTLLRGLRFPQLPA